MERTVSLFLDPDAGELAIKNLPDEKHRAEITKREIGDCLVTGTLRGVHYGSFSGANAALIVFQFNFHFNGAPPFRYKSAQIKVTFASAPNTLGVKNVADENPVVCSFYPKQDSGDPTPQEVHSGYDISVPLTTGPLLPVTLGVKARLARDTKVVRTHRMTIRGATKSDGARNHNVVMWKINENGADQDGIPHEFRCGVIVRYHQAEFRARVDLEFSARTLSVDPRLLFLSGRPWTKDDPIIFDWSNPQGLESSLKELVGVDLSTLSDQDWESILRQ